jgi:hypothetical protein
MRLMDGPIRSHSRVMRSHGGGTKLVTTPSWLVGVVLSFVPAVMSFMTEAMSLHPCTHEA